jgi:hypothetical protein
MQGREVHTKFLYESWKKGDHWEDLDVDGRRMLNVYDGRVWSGLM